MIRVGDIIGRQIDSKTWKILSITGDTARIGRLFDPFGNYVADLGAIREHIESGEFFILKESRVRNLLNKIDTNAGAN